MVALTQIPDSIITCCVLLLFSHSVVFDSLQLHGLQHARLSCLSPTPGACSNSFFRLSVLNYYKQTKPCCFPTISCYIVHIFVPALPLLNMYVTSTADTYDNHLPFPSTSSSQTSKYFLTISIIETKINRRVQDGEHMRNKGIKKKKKYRF